LDLYMFLEFDVFSAISFFSHIVVMWCSVFSEIHIFQ
jgi:hypothetical protein